MPTRDSAESRLRFYAPGGAKLSDSFTSGPPTYTLRDPDLQPWKRDAARAMDRAGGFDLEAAGDNLVTRTSSAYFNVLVQLETLSAANAAEEALKKQFDFASTRLEVGLAPITDVHEARAQYDAARASTILARNAVQDA